MAAAAAAPTGASDGSGKAPFAPRRSWAGRREEADTDLWVWVTQRVWLFVLFIVGGHAGTD